MPKNKGYRIIGLTLLIFVIFISNCIILIASAKPENIVNYKTKKADSFYSLSLRFNTTMKDISNINPEIDPNKLSIGKNIKIPVGADIIVHHIKKGETLWKIAAKYNSTVKSIVQRNNISDPNIIFTGDVLAIQKSKYDENIELLQKEIINLLKDKDFKGLAKYAHPVKGIRFSPYSYVNVKQDKVFTASQISNFASDKNKYHWGYFDGSGDKIELTPTEYFKKFVYDKDFAKLGSVNYNKNMKGVGNTIENQFEVYPGSTIVEYYYNGSGQYPGFDWVSLRMVFEKNGGKWYLTGIIHNQWTI
ncbi:MAG TPA: LysM peptidoglycan-binding domain-containing protein [Pseudobacteroides sp.]|uniref:LysM peptidoglycan-binding domain-containing protein n=1 Tax=Pseudobacteroides sp. TaxID=1968840 RepID=UPI002F95E713